MIVRTPERPIRIEDIETGSLVRIRTSKDLIQEYFVLGFYDQDRTRLLVEGLLVVDDGKEMHCAYHLYANKYVLFTRIKRFPLEHIETIQARLSCEIVDNIIQKAEQLKRKKEEQKTKRTEQKQLKKLAAKKANVYKHMSPPKDSTNTAWGSLKNASEGYIHIYRG